MTVSNHDEPRTNEDRRPKDAGFSLTEIMVAVFIMGLLSAVVLMNALPARDTAMVQKARSDIATLSSALDQYRLDMLSYPSVNAGLEALLELPNGVDRAERYRTGGYINKLPKDPWGNDYQYVVPGENGPYELFSFGADGRPDGEGLDADIRSGLS